MAFEDGVIRIVAPHEFVGATGIEHGGKIGDLVGEVPAVAIAAIEGRLHRAIEAGRIGLQRGRRRGRPLSSPEKEMDKTRPIIILKKKGGHGGHHGGAWKVAYADFVTAMMSLFIVLWLLSSSKPVQEAVGGYFRDPSGTSDKKAQRSVGRKNPADAGL